MLTLMAWPSYKLDQSFRDTGRTGSQVGPTVVSCERRYLCGELCQLGGEQIPFLQMSLLGLNRLVEEGKRESEIASLALEVGDFGLLLADVLLAFLYAMLGYDQEFA